MGQAGHGLDVGHPHLARLIGAKHSRLAGRDARGVFTHDARRRVRFDHGRARGFAEAGVSQDNRPDRACSDAFVAPGAARKKRDFINSAGRALDRKSEAAANGLGRCAWSGRAGRDGTECPCGLIDNTPEKAAPQEITSR